jgi:hypothetical protein
MIEIPCPPRFVSASSVALLTLLLGLLLSLACGSPRSEGTELVGTATAKVDPELRHAAAQLLAEGHADSSLSVLVRFVGDDARVKLEEAGLRIDSVVGDVATGHVDAGALADLAALDAVVQVQPSRRHKAY